jgi:hypothetical protein
VEPRLGVEDGGLRSAEALLLARYFMFNQVYFHHVRRIYDLHLQDFLSAWLAGGQFSVDVDELLRMTDTEVLAAMANALQDPSAPGHDPARRILRRAHFKLLWEQQASDIRANPNAGGLVLNAAIKEFGASSIRRSRATPGSSVDFPVLRRDESIASALAISEVLERLPTAAFDQVFVAPERIGAARTWLAENQADILAQPPMEE